MDKYPACSLGSDLSALQAAGYDTSDAGRGNNAMTPADVGRMTDSSSSQAAHAEHVFRDDDAGHDGIPANRHGD